MVFAGSGFIVKGAESDLPNQICRIHIQDLLSLPCQKGIFTVGEAVRSTCGNSHEKEEKEKEDHFHLSLHQTIL